MAWSQVEDLRSSVGRSFALKEADKQLAPRSVSACFRWCRRGCPEATATWNIQLGRRGSGQLWQLAWGGGGSRGGQVWKRPLGSLALALLGPEAEEELLLLYLWRKLTFVWPHWSTGERSRIQNILHFLQKYRWNWVVQAKYDKTPFKFAKKYMQVKILSHPGYDQSKLTRLKVAKSWLKSQSNKIYLKTNCDKMLVQLVATFCHWKQKVGKQEVDLTKPAPAATRTRARSSETLCWFSILLHTSSLKVSYPKVC